MAHAEASLAPLPARRLPRAVRAFLETETSGGAVLLVAAVIALAWANSPWKEGYHAFWETGLLLRVGGVERAMDLRHLVNDALMALFFFVVGLEIKRELVTGELRTWRHAALPAFGALGGMVVPAVLYLTVNAGSPGHGGWGIPMATDIAFAVGVVALLGRRVHPSLKVFLLALAIVDDIGAILVIAVFYSHGFRPEALLVAAGLVAAVVALRAARVLWVPLYALVGALLWAAVYESGVHATIAGVVLGLLAPARPLTAASVASEWSADLAVEPGPAEVKAMTALAKSTVSVAERLEHMLHPLTSFAIVPVFALANAGVTVESSALRAPGALRVAVGVALGLVAGKLLGVTAFSWAALRLRLASLPEGMRFPQLVALAATAGIGFTVSLFIAGLAFDGPELEAAAKIGILGASVAAALAGLALLAATCRRPDDDSQPPEG